MRASTVCPVILFTRRGMPASAACLAREPLSRGRTFVPAAGGGNRARRKNAACTWRILSGFDRLSFVTPSVSNTKSGAVTADRNAPPGSMKILTAKQMREVDRVTIEELGIPGLLMMENAGRNVFDLLVRKFPNLDRERVAI